MSKAILVLPLIVIMLLTAIWSGWIRIGFSLPVSNVAAQHGTLMINGFLASLIFLERAVTFKNKLVLLLPFVNSLSIAALITGYSFIAQSITIACSFGFLVMCAYFISQYKELYYYVFFTGAFCLLTGNVILQKTHLYPAAVTWWMNFLLFTIVAERLELSRFLPVNRTRQALLIIALSFIVISSFIPFHSDGNLAYAIATSGVALWLLKYDMAFKSIRSKGQHRYSGLLLIIGYAWLLITSILVLTEHLFAFGYDAVLHSFFIGFVFSMIFSHAPIILPAIAKLPLKIYRPILYVWFALLQISLVIRIIADILIEVEIRKWAGFTNGIVIILFFLTIAMIVRSELLNRKRRSIKA